MKKFLMIFCLTFCTFSICNAQSNLWLDRSFDLDGKVVFSSSDEEIANSTVIQKDGKIVVGGTIFKTGTYNHFILLRYNTDGSIDNQFGTNGKVETTITGTEDVINSIALQEDGKIVVGGTAWFTNTGYDFVLARYNTNGSLDNSFGTNGIFRFDLTGEDEKVNSIAIQPDGKIIAAGFGSLNFMLIRLNANGTIDNTFGYNGVGSTDMKNGSDRVRGVAIQSDGLIYAAGVADALSTDFAIARYKTNGTIDSTFGLNGFVINKNDGDEEGNAVIIQADGKPIVLGVKYNNGKPNIQLIRYNTNGTIDESFGNAGVVNINTSDNEEAFSLAIQKDGKIVISGYYYDNKVFSKDFMIYRLNSDGSIDLTFGENGKIKTDFQDATDDIAYSVAIQTDGKIVAAGLTGVMNNIAIARYFPSLVDDVNEQNIENSICIYPNPASDKLKISFNEMVEYNTANLTIYSIKGLQIMTQNINSEETSVDISKLLTGTYLIELKYSGKREVYKFVKE